MFKSGNRFSKILLLFFILAVPILAADITDDNSSLFYDPTTGHQVTSPPPNYSLLDAKHFLEGPPFETYSEAELSGYHVFLDTASNKWYVCGVIVPGGMVYEQLHGSILVQMDREPAPDVNVWPIGFETSADYVKNDRWGWVKYPDSIAENLYEIWWDITIDFARLESITDNFDTVGICFDGCAVDFNIWATGHFAPFDADQLLLGEYRIPISYIPSFEDAFDGVYDKYDDSTSARGANMTTYTPVALPGATFDKYGEIPSSSEFSGSYVYEGNGLQFSVLSCTGNNPPTFDPLLGNLDYLDICPGEEISKFITVTDYDPGDIITLTQISGPGILETTPGTSPVYGNYSWIPTQSGQFIAVFKATDTIGNETFDSLIINVEFNQLPVANDGDTSIAFCEAVTTVCYNVDVEDSDGDALIYALLGGGVIDPVNGELIPTTSSENTNVTLDPITGELCLTTQTGGIFEYMVEVSDRCGADTATIVFNLEINNQPIINTFDSLVYLCNVEEICFDLTASDLDAGDKLEITNTSGSGTFTPTGDGMGRQCFLPADVDSARYVFTYYVTDNCLRGEPPSKGPQDSVVITVLMGTPPSIECPPITNVNLCAPDNVCLPLNILPVDAVVTIAVTNATYENGQICFYADQTGTYTFNVTVANDCGETTCQVVFDVIVGTPPSIECPSITNVNLCAPDNVCLPLNISPSDAVVTIAESNATYENGQLCFYADQTGTYTFNVTIANDCGETTCQIVFDVTVGTPPSIECPPITNVNLCAPDNVCLPLDILPVDAVVTIAETNATYENGQICFYADQTGTYTFNVTVANDCGETTCQVIFNVTVGTPPSIECPPLTNINLCAPDNVCLPLNILPVDAVVTIAETNATYENGQICFYADQTGTYTFNVTVANDCGETTCQVVFDVTVGTPPSIECPPITNINLCAPDNVCLPLNILPTDAVVTIAETNATYENGELCFYADQTGTYTFNITVANDCGETTCQVVFDVTVGTPPSIECPPITNINLCAPDNVCLPLNISPADAVVTIAETNATYENGELCFYADQTGTYTFNVTVANACGETTCQVIFDVTVGTPPSIECPSENIMVKLCDPALTCIPLNFQPSDAIITITGDNGTYENGEICFFANEARTYTFTVTASNDCGETTCDIFADVSFNQLPEITGFDSLVVLCAPDSICFDITASDPDPNDSVTIIPLSGPGIFNLAGNGIGKQCFMPADVDSARYVFEYMITDNCLRGEPPSKCPTDSVVITVIIGTPPTIDCPPEDIVINLCAPEMVCLPLNILPTDAIITIAEEGATFENGQLCFYADQTGTYTFNVTVANDCGETICQVVFDITVGTPPSIECPPVTNVNLCAPENVCLPLNILPVDAIVAITEQNATYENGQICFYADQTGTYTFNVTVSNDCGETTCQVVFDITVGTPPSIECPSITNVNLCAPDNVCLPLNILPPDAVVTIAETNATYENGQICFYADQTGTYTFNVTVANDCGESSCQIVFDVTVGTPPSIECPQPQIVKLCGPGNVQAYIGQYPQDIQITISPEFDIVNDSIVFFAETAGEYCFDIRGENECGFDVCTFCVTVEFDSPPIISIPDTIVALCQPQEICLPVTYSDPDGNITEVSALDPYIIVNDEVCFTPAEPGEYEIIVLVRDECGKEAFDTALVNVTLNDLPTVSITDTTVFKCEASDVCIPVTFSDADGEIVSIEVDAPAYYDADNQQVCLYVDAPGTFEISISVYDDCGAMAEDIGIITATFNSPPKLAVGSYPSVACELEEICVPVMVTDIDDNVVSLTAVSSCGEEISFNETDSSFCWIPSAFSGCNLTVTVADECGEINIVRLDINIEQKPQPHAICPNDTTVFICEPGQVCIDLEEIPGSSVNILPESYVYSAQTNTICYFAEGNKTDTLMIIDSNECGADTCTFVIETKLNAPPVFSGNLKPSPEIFCDSLYLCLDINVEDPDNNLKIIYPESGCPDAIYNEETNQLCMMIRKETHCQVDLIAIDSCNASSRISIPIDAVPDRPPVISFPDIEGFVRCITDEEPIVISDICVTDPDYGDVTLVLDSGLGDFAFNPSLGCGTLTFMPPANDSVEYCFKFKATDDCSDSYKTYCINVYPATICETCIHVSIEGPPKCVNNSSISTVNITVDALENVAAFDLLLSYDATVIYFLTADLGTAINGWEFFTYRYGKDGNCEGQCPSGLLRLVGIADINNGSLHPPQDQYYPAGILASVTFKVSSDVNIGGNNVPISFFWFDCGDNTFSDMSGQYLYMDKLIVSREGNIIWDETNDDVYPESERMFGVGASDECVTGFKEPPIRCIDFKNGELCIIHPDSIDGRGDINLNGIAYEIADAVLYTNFFISGVKAFRISPPAQIAASDVNGDGLPLTIADLVHLVRIITGDISPMPKLSAVETEVPISLTHKDYISTVSVDSPESIGAALFVFSYQGDSIEEPVVINNTESMSMLTGLNDNNEFRILLYSLQAGHMIEAGESELVSLTVPDGVELRLIDVDIADYYANTMRAIVNNHALPNTLSLSQNYPNPFNPRTSFTMTLPEPSDYVVTIYNITGQAIKMWTGYGQAGQHHFEWDGTDSHGTSVSSGIYFYKASASGKQEIRKMMLLK